MPKEIKHHKTIVISDVHLGSKWSKTKEVTNFLKNNSCETLILCGDIIDGWAIMRGHKEKWKKRHTNFFRQILKMQNDTKIYYIRGNHDDFLSRLIPISFYNITILDHFIYESNNKKYYVFHGDVFDNVTSGFKWIAKLGDVGYSLLLNINKWYNKHRIKKGLPYYSISAKVKHKVKSSVSYISNFEQQVQNMATSHKCDGAICGHIHHPEIKQIGDFLYLNSGDWVESLSALTEDFEGNWNLVLVNETLEKEKELTKQNQLA